MHQEGGSSALEWISTILEYCIDSVLVIVTTGCINGLFGRAMKQFQVFNEEGVNAIVDQVSNLYVILLLGQY